ncbi:MAG: hypothetical protein ACQESR_17680 [Planctomycetota bacterium]
MESCPTQAVLPLVGLAAENVIRDRCMTFLANNAVGRAISPLAKNVKLPGTSPGHLMQRG